MKRLGIALLVAVTVVVTAGLLSVARGCIGCDIGKRQPEAAPVRPAPPRSADGGDLRVYNLRAWTAPYRPAVRPVSSHAPVAPSAPPVAAPGPDSGFYRRLAACETPNGDTHPTFIGPFQFSPDTARKLGIDGSESYAEHEAAAREWVRRLRAEGTHPGSRSGWPVCWWRAGGD